MPPVPYRGISPFRYDDHPIFFAREREAERLASLVSVYRGTMLYGETGAGKSSLINAGLLPRAVELGFQPERVRVQPRAGEALVVESLGADAGRVVLSTAEFEQRVEAACALQRPLLVFDQFEELCTLFEGGPEAGALRERIVELLVRLLRSPLPVKLLFVFREDYLGKVKELLRACPELVDQALQLAPLAVEVLPTIVRGPFERYPGHFARELDPALAARLQAALAARFGSGELSLSEVQTVCLRLWHADDPGRLLAERGVQGLLEDYLGEALDAFPPQTRFAAVALLAQMVTAAGTRNVIAADDLVQRVREEDASFAPELLRHALDRLDRESRLVRHERRRDLDLYEITSEFLVPWISERRATAQRLRERRRERRRLLLLGAVAAVLVAVVAVVVLFGLSAARERDRAESAARTATALVLASASGAQSAERRHAALLLALGAFETDRRIEARSALVTALANVRKTGAGALMHGHRGIVQAVAVSPGGGLVASAGADATVRLWSTRTHRQVGGPLRGHEHAVNDVAFTPDGRLLASAGEDGTVRFWDVAAHRADGHALHVTDEEGGVVELAVTNTLLATGSWDSRIRFFDVRTGGPAGDPLRLESGPRSLAFDRGGDRLAAGFDNGGVGLWRIDATARSTLGKGASRRTLADPIGQHRLDLGAIDSVAFSPSGHLLASTSDFGIRIWNADTGVPTGRQMKADRRGLAQLFSLAFSPDGGRIASVDWRGKLQLWSVASRRAVEVPWRNTSEPIYDVAFGPGGRMLATAGRDKIVGLWPTRPAGLAPALTVHHHDAHDVAFSPGGSLLASTSNGDGIELWSVVDRRRRGVLEDSVKSRRLEIVFSPDGRLLAAASQDDAVRLWSVATRRLLAELPAGSRGFQAIAFSSDGRTLASAGWSGRIDFWDVATRTLRWRWRLRSHSFNTLAFSPDGKRIATGTMAGRVREWDVGPRPHLHRLYGRHAGPVRRVVYSSDGALIASVSDDQSVRLWNVATGTPAGRLQGYEDGVADVTFSPGGRLLATAGADGTLRLWTLAGRRPLGLPLTDRAHRVYGVAFSPDGHTLASAASDGAHLWPDVLWRSFDGLRDEVCRLAGGGLSPAEWTEYVPSVPYLQTCPE